MDVYLLLEAFRYNEFIMLRDMLRLNQTPISANFDRDKWFNFVCKKIKNDPDNFKRMMIYLFWNKPYDEIDKDSMKVGLFTIATACEIHDINSKRNLVNKRRITDK